MTALAVLVVDDSGGFAVGAVQALFDAGYAARAATTVDAAFAELVRGVPDVVVLDHALDRSSLMLKSVLLHHRVPVLYVSGLDDDVARSVAATHDWPYLAKPFTDADLLAAVAALFPRGDPMPAPPDPRPSLVPDLPPAPAAVAPRDEPLPAPPPAAQLTPSGRPLNVPTVVQVLDRIGDMLGCVILGLLCNAGKIGGTETLIAIGAILGVGTGLRQIGARAGAGAGAGLGVVGLLLLGLGRWLAPAAGAAELARVSGVFGLLAVLVLGAAGCPKLPPVSGCAPLAQRCDGDRPQVCSPTQRWHYVGDEPCGATAGQSCAVRNGVAGCAR